MKRSGPLKRSTPLQRGSGLAPVSKSQRRRNAAYSAVRAVVLAEQGCCQRCGTTRELQTHHMAGRVGPLMTDKDNLLVLCAECHRWATEQSAEAIEQGYSRRRVA